MEEGDGSGKAWSEATKGMYELPTVRSLLD